MKRSLAICSLVCVCAAIQFGTGVSASAPAEPIIRTVYVTAIDGKGTPVTDLTAADFAVKEGGKEREVIKAELATAPMRVAMVIDDNGTGIFRAPMAQFINTLLGKALFAISSVVGQTMRLVDYTADVDALKTAVLSLGPRPGTPDGGQLLEGISETARDLKDRKAQRGVIVALTVGGEEHSTLAAHQVLDQLAQSGAILYVVSVASGLRQTAVSSKPADALEGPLNLGEVLGDGPKQTGGRHDEIVATVGIVQGLQQMAQELTHQYVITYALPDGVKPNERLSVSVKRKGVSLRAPSRIPDK
jgi:VWFA-related protein